MNREYKDCDIVFDLLPLYMDGKTGEESNAYVCEHLKQCENCRQTYQFMQEDFGELQIKEKATKRKKHRKFSKAKLLVIVVLGIYVLSLAVFICWFFGAAVLPVL